jgi:hypothetical protein
MAHHSPIPHQHKHGHPIYQSITMSQSRFLQEEYSKKIRQAANNAAINVAIADLVAARNVHHADGGKRLTKSSDSYKHVIALLQSVGVKITYNALMKRVSMIITEIRVTNTSESSVVSSLSPHGQGDDSLTSENMEKETTSHDDQSIKTPELKSSAEGRPKGSTNAKKKQDKVNKSKCIDSIVLEYSRKYNASKSVGGKVEYGYLKRLIDEKKKEFGINCSISSRTIINCTQKGTLTSQHGAKSLLEEVELALVQICIQMGKIHQPLSCTKAIVLMNSMI